MRTTTMAGKKSDPSQPADPAELPPSETWTPAQALAAAARVPFAELVVIGFSADGEPVIRHSRMRSEHMLWLADELRDYARAAGGPLKE